MSPLVLAVEPRPRGVAAVILDTDAEDGDAPPCLLPLESIVLHRIHSGASIDEAQWRRVRAEGQLTLATRHALELLARRQRTERELRRALARHFDEEAIERAVRRVRELGYLDDAAWAKSYVSSPRAADRGRALLRQELRLRGVEDHVAAGAIEEHDDHEAARAAALKRARSLRNLDAARRASSGRTAASTERRLYDFLRRRGFSDAVARRAMEEVLDAPGADDMPPSDR